MRDSYNGWKNRESFLVALWLDNEESTQATAREIAARHESDLDAGEAIETWIDSYMVGYPQSGLAADLFNAALSRVDWREIGAHFRAE